MILKMVEFFDVVDENDKVVDRRPGRECLDRGLLHRAVVVFLTNPRGEVYMQATGRLHALVMFLQAKPISKGPKERSRSEEHTSELRHSRASRMPSSA